MKKGIDNKFVEKNAADFGYEGELSAAHKEAEKKFRLFSRKYPPSEIAHRLRRYLYSQGYTSESIKAAVDTIVNVK
jgi:SOS response regulatory protein OraA/RecX